MLVLAAAESSLLFLLPGTILLEPFAIKGAITTLPVGIRFVTSIEATLWLTGAARCCAVSLKPPPPPPSDASDVERLVFEETPADPPLALRASVPVADFPPAKDACETFSFTCRACCDC